MSAILVYAFDCRPTIYSRTISKNIGTFSMTLIIIYIDKKQQLKSQLGSFFIRNGGHHSRLYSDFR